MIWASSWSTFSVEGYRYLLNTRVALSVPETEVMASFTFVEQQRITSIWWPVKWWGHSICSYDIFKSLFSIPKLSQVIWNLGRYRDVLDRSTLIIWSHWGQVNVPWSKTCEFNLGHHFATNPENRRRLLWVWFPFWNLILSFPISWPNQYPSEQYSKGWFLQDISSEDFRPQIFWISSLLPINLSLNKYLPFHSWAPYNLHY